MTRFENIMQKIEDSSSLLSRSEKSIAEFFLTRASKIEDLSADNISKMLFSSKSALTRFAQKCGFSGYREFVFEFQYQQKFLNENYDTLTNLTTKILLGYSDLMEKTKNIIDDEQLERIANLIDKSERVYFYGIGSSGLVAKEAHIRFLRLGVACEAITEQELMYWSNCTLNENCLVFGFTISGQTKILMNALEVAASKGAKTVLLSSKKIPKNKFTEQVLIATEHHLNYGNKISPQFPLILLVDIIYSKFMCHDRQRKENIYFESLGIVDNAEIH